MTGIFTGLLGQPESGSFFQLPPSFDPQLLADIAFLRRLGRGPNDVPDWPWQGFFFPDADPNMPVFGPPPDVMFNMPVLRRQEQIPPPEVPPWVGPEGKPHLDDRNPQYNRKVTPGRKT